jgi:hypothetical protein
MSQLESLGLPAGQLGGERSSGAREILSEEQLGNLLTFAAAK